MQTFSVTAGATGRNQASLMQRLLGLAAVALAVYLTAWFGIELTRETGRIAAIWIANAVLISVILKRDIREWPGLLAAGLAGNVIANLQTGDPAVLAALLSLTNTVEITVAAGLMVLLTRQRDFRRPKVMFLFCVVALGPASVAGAAMGALVLAGLVGADVLTVFVNWYPADALGLVTITPILMVIRVTDIVDLFHRRLVLRLLAVVAVMSATLAIIFLQSTLPLLFLALPAALVATFALGFPGASLAVLMTSAIALWATVHGLGPVALVDSTLREHVYVLQFFSAAIALTSLAIASLLGERNLLSAALAQAPNFYYVKNLRSEFVSVNLAVAKLAGFAKRRDLIGRSDFDIVPMQRARELFEEEQSLMVTGGAMLDREEVVTDADGQERWYETSKVALKNRADRTVGLAGVTQDITQRKKLEAELRASRNELALVLTEMSDGLAVIGADNRLVLCNDHYSSLFPLTGDLRVPGAHFPAILLAAVERGEQPDIAAEDINAWVTQIMETVKAGGEHEVRMFNGTWLHVRIKPNQNGGAIMLVSDITKTKNAQSDLLVLTEQLKVLASTDGMTGLVNRRSFDERLENEIARCRRARLPLSLIMVDIDRFKLFNDLYGHPAGDECIRKVSDVLKTGAKRPGDLVARYGGEEMCLVLPETDEGGAFFLAEQLRLAVKELALEHKDSEAGVVTISAGVASLAHDESNHSAYHLITRADQALYIAKGAGRNRVMGWSSRTGSRFERGAA